MAIETPRIGRIHRGYSIAAATVTSLIGSGPSATIQVIVHLEAQCVADNVATRPFFPDWEFNTLFGLDRDESARCGSGLLRTSPR
jgi:hypothetical protein